MKKGRRKERKGRKWVANDLQNNKTPGKKNGNS